MTSETRAKPYRIAAGEGLADVWWKTGRVAVKTSAAETGGRFSQVEVDDPLGTDPPLHIHYQEDETFYVTDTVVVDAEPETLGEALDRLPLGESATRALDALGVADRVAGPALLASSSGTELVFGFVWRVEGRAETIATADLQVFDTPGYVKVIWEVGVRPSASGGCFLSTTTRFTATDEVTRARLLAGWGVIGPFAKSLSQRTLAAVKAYAEDWDEVAA